MPHSAGRAATEKGRSRYRGLRGNPVEPPRVAYTIGRRVGSAVVRNRMRRRLRMLTREAAPLLRPGAYMISVGPEGALLSYEKLRTLLVKVLKDIEGR